MISPGEARRRAEPLGVSVGRILKDHLVSHILAALEGEPVRFFGGTALARTVLEDHRLSEDIDLMVSDVGDDLEQRLGDCLARPVGELRWQAGPRRSWMREVSVTADGVEPVRLQLIRLDRQDEGWGWQHRPVQLFYSCLPSHVALTTPSLEGFVAMKFGAFLDRWAPRDLFDLAELASRGAIDGQAMEMCRSMLGFRPHLSDFQRLRRHTAESWGLELSAQVRGLIAPEDALARVRQSIEAHWD